MIKDNGEFPDRDAELGERLAQAAPTRRRSEAEWTSLEARILAGAELPLARRRRDGWSRALAARGRMLAAAAVVVLLVLGGMVYTTPSPGTAFSQASAELVDLLGEEEVRSFFPGADDPHRLLEAAFAAQ